MSDLFRIILNSSLHSPSFYPLCLSLISIVTNHNLMIMSFQISRSTAILLTRYLVTLQVTHHRIHWDTRYAYDGIAIIGIFIRGFYQMIPHRIYPEFQSLLLSLIASISQCTHDWSVDENVSELTVGNITYFLRSV